MAARTVLVVEDDKAIQSLLREALEAEGFQVVVEKDGEWALRSLERRLPDLLITDVLLPTLGGFELVEALREMPGGGEVPVIVVSGIYRGRRHKKTAHEQLGVVAYLDKPFEIGALLAAARDALGEEYPGQKRKPRRPSPVAAALPVADDPLADRGTRAEQREVEEKARELSTTRAARGNLKHTPFAEVLAQLYRWRATGALLLRRDRVKKIVYLKEGYPIFVKSNLLSECLGRVLVKAKMISEDECEESLQKMQGKDRQQGTVLIEMGCISPHNLVYGLQLQLEEKLFEIFGWPEGDYQFSPKIDIPPQAVHLDMSIATIIYEGVRRTHTRRHLLDRLQPFLDSFLGVHEDPLMRFQEISLEADERKMVALIDGRRTTREILERSPVEELVALQLVYALLAAEMIQPQVRRARKKDSLLPQEALAPPLPVVPPPRPGASATPPPLKKRGKKARTSTSAEGGGEPVLAPSVLNPGVLDDGSVDELRKRLAERLRAMRRMNHFEVLGVSKSATPDEVKRAWFALSREVHPDRMRMVAAADVRDLAEQVAARLSRAWEVLSDDERRLDYERRLEEGTRTNVTDDVGRILQAESHFRRGEQAIKRQRWGDAEQALQEAIDLYPEEGEFFIHLGWVLFQAAQRLKGAAREERLDEAEQRLREGIQLSPRAETGYLYLGRLLKETAREAEALQQFEQALKCNPDCAEALTELQLVEA